MVHCDICTRHLLAELADCIPLAEDWPSNVGWGYWRRGYWSSHVLIFVETRGRHSDGVVILRCPSPHGNGRGAPVSAFLPSSILIYADAHAISCDVTHIKGMLPSSAGEEFKPFIRRLPEFKFWFGTLPLLLLQLCQPLSTPCSLFHISWLFKNVKALLYYWIVKLL